MFKRLEYETFFKTLSEKKKHLGKKELSCISYNEDLYFKRTDIF